MGPGRSSDALPGDSDTAPAKLGQVAELPCVEIIDHLVTYYLDEFGDRLLLKEAVWEHLRRCPECTRRLTALEVTMDVAFGLMDEEDTIDEEDTSSSCADQDHQWSREEAH
jgi:hypothetical protein